MPAVSIIRLPWSRVVSDTKWSKTSLRVGAPGIRRWPVSIPERSAPARWRYT